MDSACWLSHYSRVKINFGAGRCGGRCGVLGVVCSGRWCDRCGVVGVVWCGRCGVVGMVVAMVSL